MQGRIWSKISCRSEKEVIPKILPKTFENLEENIGSYGFLPSHQRPNKVKSPTYPKNFCTSTLSPSDPADRLRSTAKIHTIYVPK